MRIRTYSRKIPKFASRWHHRTINKHKRLNYTGENIHVTEHWVKPLGLITVLWLNVTLAKSPN